MAWDTNGPIDSPKDDAILAQTTVLPGAYLFTVLVTTPQPCEVYLEHQNLDSLAKVHIHPLLVDTRNFSMQLPLTVGVREVLLLRVRKGFDNAAIQGSILS